MLKLSHSQIEVFNSCKRQYFYKYVQKLKERENETKYMNFGSAMHLVFEDYFSKKNIDWQNNIIKRWNEFKLDGRMDFDQFKTCVINGIFLSPKAPKVEEKFFLDIDDFSFVGFIDILDDENGDILDWKSGSYSKDKVDSYKKQLLAYCFLYHKRYKKMPNTASLFFNKNNKKVTFFISESEGVNNITFKEILDYENYLKSIASSIETMKKQELKESNWEQDMRSCFFCGYKYLCYNNGEFLKYKITIKNGYCFLTGNISEYLLKGIDKETKFDLPGKHFMQESVYQKYGKRPANYEDIGTVHLFNKRYGAFSIGLLPKIKHILEDYCEFSKKRFYLEIEDLRDDNITENKLNIMPEKLITEKELRKYQQDAIECYINSGGLGYLEVATSGGKTLITAELIRRLDTRTLWIIDKKELLYQTKEEFEKVLGIECGIIGDGEYKIKDITLATIQTLNKRVLDRHEETIKFLNSINFAIVDESHHAASSSYSTVFKELKNTKYRLGTTGTAKRDDKQEPMMFSLLGDIIYKITAEELISQGYLMKPTIHFIKLNKEYRYARGNYAEDYQQSIVENSERNEKILNYVIENKNKKILILTKKIEHGQALFESILDFTPCFYIHGSSNKDDRIKNMESFKNNSSGVLIATISIAGEGLNIPDLDIIINASANKGDVKSIQTLGRVLRKIENKQSATYIDFLDVGYYTKKHSRARIKSLRAEGHIILENPPIEDYDEHFYQDEDDSEELEDE